MKCYATGFVHIQCKCVTKENLNTAPDGWESIAGSVWFYTDDAMTQIPKREWQCNIQ